MTALSAPAPDSARALDTTTCHARASRRVAPPATAASGAIAPAARDAGRSDASPGFAALRDANRLAAIAVKACLAHDHARELYRLALRREAGPITEDEARDLFHAATRVALRAARAYQDHSDRTRWRADGDYAIRMFLTSSRRDTTAPAFGALASAS